ncbi:50S ribosomal protein L17 [Candidatus Phytoplasma prunorum]|uniref:50S ribosomal protein L17 n=1 Tax=Candidatus Phytoplasma prunorum TaxID=47565 RepID=UPI002FF09601
MAYSKLRRNKSQRKSLLRSLVSDLIIKEKIITTESKAKELQKNVEKVITLAKKNSLHSRRQAIKKLFDENINKEQTVIQKLFKTTARKYINRNGGCTRIIKTVPRRGDAAPMAIITFV